MSFLELPPGTQLRGLGENYDETPGVKALPWNIDVEPAGPTAAERRWDRLEKLGAVAGVAATLLGLFMSVRAFRRGED